jgi:hypothetical protein
MINLTSSYRINYVKTSSGGKTTFGIRDYNPEKKDEKNYARICASNQIVLNDGDEVQLDKITGCGLSRYEGQLQVMLFATVKLAKTKQAQEKSNTGPVINTNPADNPYLEQRNVSEPIIDLAEADEPLFDQGPLLDISSDDLPF